LSTELQGFLHLIHISSIIRYLTVLW
jgi:hypothetical protein